MTGMEVKGFGSPEEKRPFVDKGEPQQVSDVLFTAFIIQ